MAPPPRNEKALDDFAHLAETFCALAASADSKSVADLAEDFLHVLPQLKKAIAHVEMRASDFDEDRSESLRGQHYDSADSFWWKVRSIGSLPHDAHATFFCCQDTEPGIRAIMFYDDISDLLTDIHHGLVLWRIGTDDARDEASWQWASSFESHWNYHLRRALTTLYEYRRITRRVSD